MSCTCEYLPSDIIDFPKRLTKTQSLFSLINYKSFNQEQRIKYWLDEDIIGKTITVQYFEETSNQNGGISLRFPTVKHIYEGERDC